MSEFFELLLKDALYVLVEWFEHASSVLREWFEHAWPWVERAWPSVGGWLWNKLLTAISLETFLTFLLATVLTAALIGVLLTALFSGRYS